ncbi:carbon-nitrogen hydrolase family protein [Corynebacterium lubricantis]|uniref:carbon-nitrogen hydrolase family protein n=1 Tax=Corynebacterium lubricantis TaxID=541095 RepID=UPI00039C2C01|nr:carbon-nitrogen hydrolase family protein [Corynebacterium lubricantis]
MKVAVVQATSIPFETEAAVTKVVDKLREAGSEGAKIAVFPEAFIGGYPKGATFGAPLGTRSPEGRELYRRYAEAAITLDGPELESIAQASAESGVFAVVGIIERVGKTLYCSVVMIDPEQGLVGKHRKLMPTALERLTWGFGDGSTLDVVDSPAGKLGAVVCWENYIPMLRQAMYAQGVQIYCAPTVDDRDTWSASMQHIAAEGRVFVLSAVQVLHRDQIGEDLYEIADELGDREQLIRGGSMIVDPLGQVLAGPVYGEETILYADLDLDQLTRGYFDLDVAGHYSRPDVFQLHVNTAPQASVVFE